MASKKSAKSSTTSTTPAARKPAARASAASAPAARSAAPAGTFMEWMTSPTVKYIAGGVATAVLTRIASNIATKYPELSNFLKENIDTVESKLSEFKTGLNSDNESSSLQQH